MEALESLVRDSELFGDAARGAPPDARVPSCPAWVGADLVYHLAEVQDFWARVVGPAPGRGVAGPDVTLLARPASDAELPALLQRSTSALVAALRGRDPHEPCWSWHADGGRVGWVLRRQAHEALIHRVDAELTAGRDVTPADPAVAADGVDEALTVLVDAAPGWGVFTPDGTTVSVVVDDPDVPPRVRRLALGRFAGTGPESGTVYDLDAARLVDLDGPTTAQVGGPAWALDLWLWGRGGADGLDVAGDPTVADRLRRVAAQGMQ
ncbi:maleylpyruvate isomerase N-terminal domain-containing protein [Cellulosimicrobium marinum]|uniref:maleylpyruvate isomerase N-terminal domain-containing protein n=1 Tax=Cellulosimicrobium marinum TaxID=1638992 RepID=UPI001E349655|nr:maleylpyruvate isomerase N-terminal domain-containing protein [Cellulosimicrobium marinum]MCB7136643.1 maleylpyruvate isomerase N-terminal domain-containing protein [Cellulosimicrobium marinum]